MINNEKINSKQEKFKKTASKRTSNILKALKVLGNCSNKNIYKYTPEDIDKIFKAIENKVIEIEGKFNFGQDEDFEL